MHTLFRPWFRGWLRALCCSALAAQGQSLTPFDFGDAPDPYPTKLNQNGARHRIIPSFHLGLLIDAETDGQPNSDASGDAAPAGSADDEDGVVFLGPLTPGPVAVQVTASERGQLDAWIDFNQNGSWADEGEKIFNNVALLAGANSLSFVVPANALSGTTFARFRLSRKGGLSFDGVAEDGEVEDYQVTIGPSPCQQGSQGTDFWLTFPGNYAPDPDNPLQLRLCIVGTRGTSGNVKIPGLGFSASFVIPATQEVTIPIPKAADLGAANELIEDKGIHVAASAPVGVFGLSHVQYTTDGYVAFPTAALGFEYLVQGFANVHTGVPTLNGTQFGLVACENDTKVIIIPRIKVGAHPANAAYSIALQAGQTYQLRGTNDAPMDLTGTRVMADKRIAVFGGHQCANVLSSSVIFCDYLVEQLPAVQTWGSSFVSIPFATRSGGDTYRVLAAEDGTAVSVNGALAAILDAGQSQQLLLSGPAQIASDHPICVAQYANSSDFDGVVNADPLMMILPHTGQFQTRHLLCVPNAGFGANFLSVVAPSAAVGAVSLDGAPIAPALFAAIPLTAYSGARIPVSPGAHSLNGPQPFEVLAYGWAEYDAYGWPSGFLFGDTTPPVLTCPPDITVTAGTGGISANFPCSGFVPDLRSQVKATDDCSQRKLVITQSPAPGTVVGVGSHPITLSAVDANGNRGQCVTVLTVVGSGQTQIHCPSNIVVQCKDSNGTQVFYDAFSQTACGDRTPLECSPPSGSIFPPGLTQVICLPKDPGQLGGCTFTVRVDCRRVHISLSQGGVTLSFAEGQILEQAPTVAGPWTVVPNAQSPFTAELLNTQSFFRVREPDPGKP